MAKKNIKENLPSKADVMNFIMMYDFLESAYVEMKDFSKKNPDGALNDNKVKRLNRILKDIKDILVDEPTASYLDILDDEMLPSNSDVVLTMSQYRSAMENFRKKYRVYHDFHYHWHTSDGEIKAIELEGERPQWK
jgi:hypothetical protein